MNSVRKFSADANPKISARVELFCETSPSTGPEHAAVCVGIDFVLLCVLSVHANEHLESDSPINPSILRKNPNFKCLNRLFSDVSVIANYCL